MRIAIEDIELETLVVEGTSAAALRAGAGHYPSSPLPGEVGNVAIAGHRTTYGRPFNRLDELDAGADIWLSTPVGDYRYEVVADEASAECRSARRPTAPTPRPASPTPRTGASCSSPARSAPRASSTAVTSAT